MTRQGDRWHNRTGSQSRLAPLAQAGHDGTTSRRNSIRSQAVDQHNNRIGHWVFPVE